LDAHIQGYPSFCPLIAARERKEYKWTRLVITELTQAA